MICAKCGWPLQLWGTGSLAGYYVHVTEDGQYVYHPHKPVPVAEEDRA